MEHADLREIEGTPKPTGVNFWILKGRGDKSGGDASRWAWILLSIGAHFGVTFDIRLPPLLAH